MNANTGGKVAFLILSWNEAVQVFKSANSDPAVIAVCDKPSSDYL
jgi:hypothetical protein